MVSAYDIDSRLILFILYRSMSCRLAVPSICFPTNLNSLFVLAGAWRAPRKKKVPPRRKFLRRNLQIRRVRRRKRRSNRKNLARGTRRRRRHHDGRSHGKRRGGESEGRHRTDRDRDRRSVASAVPEPPHPPKHSHGPDTMKKKKKNRRDPREARVVVRPYSGSANTADRKLPRTMLLSSSINTSMNGVWHTRFGRR